MSFSEIVGHTKQLQILRLALAQSRLHHAYLFVGREGVGKRTVALSLAKAIHCSAMQNDFCGQCVNCIRIEDRNHTDVRLIEPLTGKKEISIQQIRELEKELYFRSYSGRKKIVIVDPANLLNLAGQNALLKTLEEPPEDSLLILIAIHAGGLLPTIRSRCLRLSFGPLPAHLLCGLLVSGKGMKKADAEFLSALAMGSLGAAIKIDGAALREKRKNWVDRLGSLHHGDYRGALEFAEAIAEDKDTSLSFLQWAETWFRDLAVYRITQDSREIVNQDMVPQVTERSQIGDIEGMLSALRQTARAGARIHRNLNRRMVLERLLLNVVGER